MKNFTRLIALLLAMLILAGCGVANNQQETNSSETQPPQTQNETTGKPDSAEDDTLNILMVGNSFCYYFCEELYYMLKTAGIKANVCNVYKSGCTLEQHWNGWKEGSSIYEFIVHDKTGKHSTKGVNLEHCLEQYNWDVITLQEGSSIMRKGDPTTELGKSAQYRQDLYTLFAEKFPQAKLYWQQTWAYQVGYESSTYTVDAAEQAAYHQRQRAYALGVCKENNVSRIPSGDAWKIVRDGGYDNLCARADKNNGLGDNYHDGDLGGGQYLNACVWFETLTGQSCVGNLYRPPYFLSEDLVTTLQNAAHQAVANLRAEQSAQ